MCSAILLYVLNSCGDSFGSFCSSWFGAAAHVGSEALGICSSIFAKGFSMLLLLLLLLPSDLVATTILGVWVLLIERGIVQSKNSDLRKTPRIGGDITKKECKRRKEKQVKAGQRERQRGAFHDYMYSPGIIGKN
jgi:hypothetical protein